MSESCTHNCSTCGSNCASRESDCLLKAPHPDSCVKKIIGVVSGKGGVGKSTVTELLAIALAKKGFHCGILDADITGPSIPKAFGVTEKADGDENAIYPVATKELGIDLMSINLLLDNPSDPVVWRGPVIAGTVTQFWTDVIWKDVDYLLIDMPPGTGDVALTVFQSIPLDGIVIVSTPQNLVSMIVEKALKMAQIMNIPILGLIENMSYLPCPDCGKKISVFGESHVDEIAAAFDLPVLAKMPIDPHIASLIDEGCIESADVDYLDSAVKGILA